MTDRDTFAALLAVVLTFSPYEGTSGLGVRNGTVVEVWYSDAPFGLPWMPTWISGAVFRDRIYRLDGRGWFPVQHVTKHLKWRVK